MEIEKKLITIASTKIKIDRIVPADNSIFDSCQIRVSYSTLIGLPAQIYSFTSPVRIKLSTDFCNTILKLANEHHYLFNNHCANGFTTS